MSPAGSSTGRSANAVELSAVIMGGSAAMRLVEVLLFFVCRARGGPR